MNTTWLNFIKSTYFLQTRISAPCYTNVTYQSKTNPHIWLNHTFDALLRFLFEVSTKWDTIIHSYFNSLVMTRLECWKLLRAYLKKFGVAPYADQACLRVFSDNGRGYFSNFSRVERCNESSRKTWCSRSQRSRKSRQRCLQLIASVFFRQHVGIRGRRARAKRKQRYIL